jgi:sugar phosphate isomerase/epimerase
MSRRLESKIIPTLIIPKPALTTDFLGADRPIQQFAPLMADAGFEQVLWCEQWDGDFAYTHKEVATIERIFRGLNLQTRDVHATEGAYYGQWVAPDETERQKGVKLVKNRLAMAEDLGAQTIVLHAPHHEMDWKNGPTAYQDCMFRSLDELQPYAMDRNIKIALENCDWKGPGKIDNFGPIEFAMNNYPSQFIGICYDSGHGNLMRQRQGNHMGRLEKQADRIEALHLHDNKGVGEGSSGRYKIQEGRSHDDDMHRLMFSGTVEWNRLAQILGRSTYTGPMMMEASMKYDPDMDPKIWLQKAMQTGFTFSAMVASYKNPIS